jgi:hypothetical protein
MDERFGWMCPKKAPMFRRSLPTGLRDFPTYFPKSSHVFEIPELFFH